MYPTCFVSADTKGEYYIRNYESGTILKKFPEGTFRPKLVTMKISFNSEKIQIIRYSDCHADLPSAILTGYRKVALQILPMK